MSQCRTQRLLLEKHCALHTELVSMADVRVGPIPGDLNVVADTHDMCLATYVSRSRTVGLFTSQCRETLWLQHDSRIDTVSTTTHVESHS